MKVNRLEDHLWQLLESYTSPVFPDKEIQKGFMWNGASIPQMARMILNNADKGVLEASCLHDLLYATKGRVSGEVTLTRKQVDLVFLHELRYYGISYWIAYAAYQAVRMGGGSHWG